MILSMTGFGAGEVKTKNSIYKVEIRSLNSNKGLDINIKLPSHFKIFENNLRQQLNTLNRGKVDVQVVEEIIHESENESLSILNIPLMNQYYHQIKRFIDEHQIENSDILSVVLGMPNVYSEKMDEGLQSEILKALTESCNIAIEKIEIFRKREGAHLKNDLEENLLSIENFLSEIVQFEPERIQKIRMRLEKELSLISTEINIDRGRLEQEMIYYIEKLDINEEKIRLGSHIHYFRDTLQDNSTDIKGKKLGFLVQEMGREINTIGSKANDAEIQKRVVLMKNELEKIKEQVNNIL